MAEMAIAAAALMGTGAAAGGTAIASASTVLATLQGVATTVSVISTIAGTLFKASATQDQAKQAEMQGTQTKIESLDRQTRMKRELLKALGANDVRFAAGGTRGGQGIALSTARQSQNDTTREISIERANSNFRTALYRARAQGLRRKAGTELFTGLLGAVGTGIQGRMSQIKLGQ